MAIAQRGSVIAAADPGADEYGYAVALSGSGAVLAVGARWWDGTLTDQGGVYIYDYTGSAWAARGSVLVAGTPAASEWFGASVALSGDGSVLAVGVSNGNGGTGAVYIYDWSGSAWVQRGSALVASDAVSGNQFGSSVALSADASVLAVGAQARALGGLVGAGAVYLYDWSGAAWVQRGSVMTAADAGSADRFGSSVALSGTAGVLAVGAYLWDGTASDQGGVYLYDWSGSAWAQRGSVLVAGDAGGTDWFGRGVALSDDAAVLVVAATQWDALSNQGATYIYDWSGSAWAQRDAVLVAADAGTSDYFGSAVAVSSDASVIAVGARGWDNSVTDQGGVYIYDVSVSASGDVVSAPTALTVELATGTVSAPTELTVELSAGVVSAPTALTVSWPTGTATAPTALTVTASGAASAPTALALTGTGHAPIWRARCLIDGVDVSARLVGRASVTAEEGAARIAALALLPTPGVVAPLDYVGKTISLDYVEVIAGVEVPRRLFTGRIDTPAYDPDTQLLSLTCTDDLQNRVAALDRSVIDALVGGRYSTAVQGETDDSWDYAQARLETVAASLDAGASGGMRVTPWQSATTWATFDESDLLYQRMRLELPQRSTLVNRVDIAFDYRYPRLRQRFSSAGWSGTHIDMEPAGWAYPTQQDILGAAGGTGWTVTAAAFYPAPAAIPHSSGGFIVPAEGSIDMAILTLTQRHSQTVTERYALTVTAPESVTANGELAHAVRGALASGFSGSAWESALDVAPLFTADGEVDHAPDAPRADAEYAIQTLLDQANVKILGSHRRARVGNAILCNPDLDVDKRVAIATAGVAAAGKVASVTHTLDFDGGSALSEFEVAVFGAGGAGILTPDELAPPAADTAAADDTHDWPAEVPSMWVNVYGVTAYTEDLMGLLINPPETITVENVPGEGTVSYANPYYAAGSYPATGFRMSMPGVDDASRNPLDLDIASAYQVVIPVDTLQFTVS